MDSMKKPVGRTGRTIVCRTVEQKPATLIASNPNLPPGENAVANHAHPFVVERMPFSLLVSRAEQIESFFESEMSHG